MNVAKTDGNWSDKLKVYGPYMRKDGRQHVIIYGKDYRRTVSYPKWLMEQHLGRELDPDLETIDHIDGDFTNNDLSNLRVIPRVEHTRDDAVLVEPIEIICVWCGKKEFKDGHDLRGNSKRGKAGPFCGRSCAGKYGRAIQMGTTDKLSIQPSPKGIYYRRKDGKKITGRF